MAAAAVQAAWRGLASAQVFQLTCEGLLRADCSRTEAPVIVANPHQTLLMHAMPHESE